MTSGEIGTGLTCDSQYFEIYNSQYIEILCVYSQYLNIRFFPLSDNKDDKTIFSLCLKKV